MFGCKMRCMTVHILFLHLTCRTQWKILKRIPEDSEATTLGTPGSLNHCLVVNCPERPLTLLDSCVNEKYTSVISCPYNIGIVSLTTFDLTNKTIITHYMITQVKDMMLQLKQDSTLILPLVMASHITLSSSFIIR